jgi:hypothetical protein
MTKIAEISAKEMKFKIRLAAGNATVSAKITPEGPFSALQ